MKPIFLFFIIFCAVQVKGHAVDTVLNRPAKPVVFQQVLNKTVKPGFYHGKIFVLDFWATWCAPCIAGFPHFNELSKKYTDSGVVFASITNEPLSVVNKFFTRTKKELRAIKLIDTTRATMDEYGVLTRSLGVGIPYCIIIDKNNIVKWTGYTYELTENIIDGVIHPERTYAKPVTPQKPVKPFNKKPVADRALFTFSAAKSDTNNFNSVFSESHQSYYANIVGLSSRNNPLADAIELISGFSKTRFITNDTVKLKQLTDIYYKLGADTMRFKAYSNTILKDAPVNNFVLSLLGEAFKFNAKIINQKQKHYELIIADTAKLHSFMSMSPTHKSSDFDHFPAFEIVGSNLKDMIAYLESDAKIIITNHTKDNNRYDLSLDVSNPQILNKSLQFHGLKLIEVNDDVEMLDITFY